MFNDVYNGKKVLVTGHTGFKGSWLTSWLLDLGADVCGISLDIPTTPSIFVELDLEHSIEHHICDIRNLDKLKEILTSFNPDYLFHLAAQPIVSESYKSPLETISTNVIGTANILEALRYIDSSCNAVIITSDKCYENVEWPWGYKETDHLGGKDIYSGSKGAAELIFHSYQKSFFPDAKGNVRLATGRAGNVIGGGDWATDRIVADCMRSWSSQEIVKIRCPSATRPWQHVLEPLSGYLWLGKMLGENEFLHGEQFNFGPRAEQNRTVIDLINGLQEHWKGEALFEVVDNIPFNEAGLLKLNCDKSLFYLNWEATLKYSECVRFVGEWYHEFYHNSGSGSMREFTLNQIREYQKLASVQNISWSLI